MDSTKPYNNLPLLPPSSVIETNMVLKKAISANRRLAELKGAVNLLPNHGVLIDGIVLQEAKLSSEIENIVTTNDELYTAAADEKQRNNPHAKEVLRYRQALWHGFDALKVRPLSTNLFVEIVEIIKGMKVDIRRVPGTRIVDANGTTVYTPPEGESVIRDKLKNLEDFIHTNDEIDPLIKMAIMHYQFEAIHPFSDGNGRTGRIINILFLLEKQLLDSPVLFLSRYILKTKSFYYEGLRKITEQNLWIDWIIYMLSAIEETAIETHAKIHKIANAMKQTKEQVKEMASKIYSKDLIETLFKHPYCKVRFIVDAGIAKRQTAALYLQRLEQIGLLQSIKVGRETYYINLELMKILGD